jgi:prevent-host-death family protein
VVTHKVVFAPGRASTYIPQYPERTMADVVRVPATEFGKEVGRYQDLAQSQTVIVTRNGRDRAVMISAEEYQRLKRRDRQVYAAGELPDEIVEAVRGSDMDSRHQHLDDLIKDWAP